MSKNTIVIEGDNAEGKVARIIAELVREGVVFECSEWCGEYRITLTGGF